MCEGTLRGMVRYVDGLRTLYSDIAYTSPIEAHFGSAGVTEGMNANLLIPATNPPKAQILILHLRQEYDV